MFQMVIDEARSLIRHRNEIEAQADDLLRHSQDYQLLRQIPGIGPIEALTVIAEAGDLRRLGHHRQFLKFCGLDLSTQKSGEARPAFQPRHTTHSIAFLSILTRATSTPLITAVSSQAGSMNTIDWPSLSGISITLIAY
ncbi:hypothetical protein X728_24735 [Mesorhizobium sp. L103C120A0]|nr:hypothetical protein X728_24735 [Mesorhizobium sp. L103C120A0]